MYKIDRRGGVQKSFTRTDPAAAILGKPDRSNVNHNI